MYQLLVLAKYEVHSIFTLETLMRLPVLLNIMTNIYLAFGGFLINSVRTTVATCLAHLSIYNFLPLIFNQYFNFFL